MPERRQLGDSFLEKRRPPSRFAVPLLIGGIVALVGIGVTLVLGHWEIGLPAVVPLVFAYHWLRRSS